MTRLRSGLAPRSDAVFQLRLSRAACAIDAAINFSTLLDAVTDYPAVTVRANWRQRVDRTLEAIERVMLAGHDYFKRLVVVIFANFAFSHT